jgi:hypothetical protein
MYYEVKLNGRFYDILYYEHGYKKLKAMLILEHPDKFVKLTTRR